uniref:p2C21 n=1 Tax=Arundo donax TaxID=35708 RepID=A0A0A9HV31_ARUDO
MWLTMHNVLNRGITKVRETTPMVSSYALPLHLSFREKIAAISSSTKRKNSYHYCNSSQFLSPHFLIKTQNSAQQNLTRTASVDQERRRRRSSLVVSWILALQSSISSTVVPWVLALVSLISSTVVPTMVALGSMASAPGWGASGAAVLN